MEFLAGCHAALAGDDGPDALAAEWIVAETVLLHRQWLLTHKKDQ